MCIHDVIKRKLCAAQKTSSSDAVPQQRRRNCQRPYVLATSRALRFTVDATVRTRFALPTPVRDLLARLGAELG